jgi:hypothetical protein
MQQAGEKLAKRRGQPFRLMKNGDRVTGIYRESVALISGRYTLIEEADAFTLVLWRPVIKEELGRTVAGSNGEHYVSHPNL